jgi:hypothetical protein
MGFIAAIAPSLMDMLRARFAHKRDIEQKQQQIDAAKAGLELAIAQNKTIEDLQTQNEQLALAAQDATGSDCAILNFLRSSVRPILTYAFFVLFAIIKLVAIHHAFVVDHASALNIVPLVWDEDAESLFAAVISFWFGSRAVSAAYAQRKKSDVQVTSNLKGRNNGGPVVSGE